MMNGNTTGREFRGLDAREIEMVSGGIITDPRQIIRFPALEYAETMASGFGFGFARGIITGIVTNIIWEGGKALYGYVNGEHNTPPSDYDWERIGSEQMTA